MKPFVTRHNNPAEPLKYALSEEREVILATMPWIDLKTACVDFNSVLRLAPKKRNRIAHVTLSLPRGYRLNTKDWRRVVRHVLNKLGLDVDRHPILAARHHGTDCDHVHVVASRVSWLGDTTTLLLDETTSARIHVDLTARLGLPEPEYPILTPAPRLKSRLPARQKSPEVRELHHAVASVLSQYRPVSLDDLGARLAPSGFRVVERDVAGKPLPTLLRKNGRPFRRTDLKPDLTSREILARLSHVRALSSAMRFIRAYVFVKSIDRHIVQYLKDQQNARNTENTDNPGIAGSGRNPPEPYRASDVGRALAAPAPRPSGRGENRGIRGRERGFDGGLEVALHDNDQYGSEGRRNRHAHPTIVARDRGDPGSPTNPNKLTYGAWLRSFLSAVRSAPGQIQFQIVQQGMTRIIFNNGARAVLHGLRLTLSDRATTSKLVNEFIKAFPMDLQTEDVREVDQRKAKAAQDRKPEPRVDTRRKPQFSAENASTENGPEKPENPDSLEEFGF